MLTNILWGFVLIYSTRQPWPPHTLPAATGQVYREVCRGKQGRLKVFACVPLRRECAVKVKLGVGDVSRLQTRQRLDKSDAAGHADTSVSFFMLLILKQLDSHSYEGNVLLPKLLQFELSLTDFKF